MMYLNSLKTKNKHLYIKGIFSGSIPYENRNPSKDWSQYFGTWEGQKHEDLDSNCCWAYAQNEVLEDQLEFLMKSGRMAPEDLKWFKDNGYIVSDGDFYLSRRFIPILSGVKNNGGSPELFWDLTIGTTFKKGYGAIPNSKLPFTNNVDYFDPAFITQEMYALGREFLKHVKISYEELAKRWTVRTPEQIQEGLSQTELTIGIPVPQDGSWNQVKVNYPGTKTPQHEVALYKYDPVADPDYPYFIYDQYQPMLKQLSKDYYIPIITKAVIDGVDLSPKLTVSIWVQLVALLRKLGVLLNGN